MYIPLLTALSGRALGYHVNGIKHPIQWYTFLLGSIWVTQSSCSLLTASIWEFNVLLHLQLFSLRAFPISHFHPVQLTCMQDAAAALEVVHLQREERGVWRLEKNT